MRPISALDRAVLGEAKHLAHLGPEEWEAMAPQVAEEGLEGLLYRRCAAGGLALPAAVAGSWQARYRQTAQTTFAALQGLGALADGLAAQGLAVLVLPGAALLSFYPDPGCRPMDDVDLLVRPEAEQPVRAFLQARGFAALPRHPGLLVRGSLALDLHTDLLNTARIRTRRFAAWMDLDEVWRDRRAAQLEGMTLHTMGLEDMALYTVVHALRHSYRRLTWFLDLQLLLEAGLCWEGLEHKAVRYNLVRPLVYGLHFLRDRAGYPLPVPAISLLARIPLRAGEQFLLRQTFSDRRRGEWGDVLWSFSIPQAGRRWRFLVETCFPKPQVLLQVFPYLPTPLYPLAYGLRLFQLLLRGCRQLLWMVARTWAHADRVAL